MKEKFIWEFLDEEWSDLLLSNNFMKKDCPKDGNCQFSSLSNSLKKTTGISPRKLRKLVSDYIIKLPDIKFKTILESYKLEQENGDFYGNWNPESVKTKRQFAKEVKKMGFNFEGDYVTLSLLNSILKIDFIIFNQNNHTITKIENDKAKDIILLNFIQYDNTGHYKSIGLKLKDEKYPITIFQKNDLPKELSLLFNKSKFFTKHIKNIYNDFPSIKCNEIISKLQDMMTILTKIDKKIIYRTLAKLI